MPLAPLPPRRDLADDLMGREGRDATPFGLYVVGGNDPAAELGREVERAVFLEYFGNSPELLAEEYQAYDTGSVFLVVLDHATREPAGTMRLLRPGFPSKSLEDIGRGWGVDPATAVARSCPQLDPASCWDVATLAVMPGYRRTSTAGLISMALYQGVGALSHHHGIGWLVAILDVVVLDLIQALLRQAFRPFAGLEPRNYLDSPSSLPVYLDLVAHRRKLQLVDPALHAMVTHGTGLEAAMSTPTWHDPKVVLTSVPAAA